MTLINKVDQFSKDTDIAHRLVHGAAHETIPTDGGPLPTFAGALGGITDVPERLKALEDGQAADRIVKLLWSELAQVPTTADGMRGAEVIGDDGSHVDPVTQQVVPNNGGYIENSLGWRYARADVISTKASRAEVATVAGEVFPGNVAGGFLECDVDSEGRVSYGVHPDGGREFIRTKVGGFNVTRVGDNSADVSGRFSMHGVYEEYAANLTGELEHALIVEVDDWMRVGRIVWRDGSTWTAPSADQQSAQLLEMISLPNGALAENPNGGFTCTGLDRFASGSLAYCWPIGNHGLARVGNAKNTPSIVIVSPDMRRIVRELPCTDAMFPGIGSIQGVAIRHRDNTIYFVDKSNQCIRRISMNGEKMPGEIYVTHTPNALAYHPTLDAIYTAHEGEGMTSLIDCETGNLIWQKPGIPASADHISFYAPANELMVTLGANGSAGTLQVHDADTLSLKRTLRLVGSEAIEGVYREGDVVTTVNDGAYHLEAKPALSLACKYRIF